MSQIRKFINILEAPELKKQVIDLVKQTDDQPLLQKVYNALAMGDLPTRLETLLSKDADASKFVTKIASTIVAMNYPPADKEAFIKQYPKGFINTESLLSGSKLSFNQFVTPGLPASLFKILSVELTSQGVGPGEVALAVLSPHVSWSGRAVGGGDVQIGNKAVEVKTTVSSGGRWMNPRKANMNMPAIAKAITTAIAETRKKNKQKGLEPFVMPDRVNVIAWAEQIRPMIDPSLLPNVTKTMADAYFNQVKNTAYQKALLSGNGAQIRDAIITVGYANYKKYSNFAGILLMDIKSESAQYFEEVNTIKGDIKVDTAYVYAPEGEAMPKVSLLNTSGPTSDADMDTGDETGDIRPKRKSKKEPEAPISTHNVKGLRPTKAAPKPVADSPRARR